MFNKEKEKEINSIEKERERELAISFFGRPALGDFPDHKARQPLKFVAAYAAKT